MRPVPTRKLIAAVSCAAALGLAVQSLTSATEQESHEDPVKFEDARSDASRYIAYHRSVKLTQQQEAIKEEALSAIRAPCCKDYTIATCCCPCNLAKSVWGLSELLIVERGYGAEQVQSVVEDWIHFTNGDGYSGTACYKGRCGRPFAQDGCGGMNEQHVS
jgi:hypothetical protein